MSKGLWKNGKLVIKSRINTTEVRKVEVSKDDLDTIHRHIKGAEVKFNDIFTQAMRGMAECPDCYDNYGWSVGCKCKRVEK